MSSVLSRPAPLRLCLMSHPRLTHFAMPIVETYRAVAQIEVVDATFELAVSQVREKERIDSVDVFISAGANAAIIREAATKPVISVKINGYDVLLALMRAREIGRHVGIISYRKIISELDAVKNLLDISVTQYAYNSVVEIQNQLRMLADNGVRVIVGSSLVVELAEQYGLVGILAYSTDSLRAAFEEALEIGRVSRSGFERLREITRVLSSLRLPVLAVDRWNRVIALNPPMESVLGMASAEVLGRYLEDIAPPLSLSDTTRTGQEDKSLLLRFRRQEWVAMRTPIRDANDITGAVLTLQSPQTIHDADVTLRVRRKRSPLHAKHTFDDLAGKSPAFRRTVEKAKRYAATDLTIAIHGESGSGKEMFAQAIHNESARADGPFVAVNCAAFPESLLESELFGYEEGAFTGGRRGGRSGLFETAHTGTLFLDEIGDMPLHLQTRLLRVLQEREVVRLGSVQPIPIDVRILTATHRTLEQLVRDGRFRSDLFYRINTLELTIPPLRERVEDIEELATAMLAMRLRRYGVVVPASRLLAPLLAAMKAHVWHGNVRELENVCERIAVYAKSHPHPGDITLAEWLEELPQLRQPTLQALTMGPEEAIGNIVARFGGNKTKAAEALGISRSTLWRKLQRERGRGV